MCERGAGVVEVLNQHNQPLATSRHSKADLAWLENLFFESKTHKMTFHRSGTGGPPTATLELQKSQVPDVGETSLV